MFPEMVKCNTDTNIRAHCMSNPVLTYCIIWMFSK